MRAASDFAEQEGGYADCLLSINSATLNGEDIDFSEWGEEAKDLANVEPETLSAVIGLIRDFHSHNIAKLQQKSKNKPGKPRIEMPENFAEQARLWGEGKISAVKAAQNCKVSYHAFLNRAREFLSREAKDENSVWEAWKKGELSDLQAANQLGCSSGMFRRLVKEKGLRKNYTPAAFDEVCTLWENGELRKRDAAQRLNISVQRFDDCLKRKRKISRKNAERALFSKAYQLWHDGIICQRSAFDLCGRSRYFFMERVKKLGLKEKVAPVSLYLPTSANLPQAFCDAYRQCHLGKISKKEAQKLSGQSKENFERFWRLMEEPVDVKAIEEKFLRVAGEVQNKQCSLRKASRELNLPIENIKRLLAHTGNGGTE